VLAEVVRNYLQELEEVDVVPGTNVMNFRLFRAKKMFFAQYLPNYAKKKKNRNIKKKKVCR
jgi:hypothetical protein